MKEQTIIYKNKIDNDTSGQYLEVALESCRNENEILKKNKTDLEKSLTPRQIQFVASPLNRKPRKFQPKIKNAAKIKF